MKTTTHNILDHMFSKAEEKMYQDGWSQDEITVFKNDPVIRLFYGACAEEIGKVQEEIYHVEQRLINKTIQYLLPEAFHAPSPAHAVFQARTLDKLPECTISPEYQFSVGREEKSRTRFMFTPAGNYPIYQSEVEYLFFRNRLYQNEDGQMTRLLTGNSSLTTQDDFFWIGIKDLDQILPKDKISLFFTMPLAGSELYSFLSALKFCKCTSGDKPVNTKIGLTGIDTDIRYRILKQPDYLINKIFQDARNWYQNHFLTLSNLTRANQGEPPLPAEISRMFTSNEIEKIKGDIYWIKFAFSNLLKETWIENLFCSMNCFPAVNLKIEQEQFDIESMPINIFPISCEDFILTIKNISGKQRSKQEETSYHYLDAQSKETVGLEGQAIFKKGSLRHLDPAKLKAMLNHLSTLLKEETILLTKDGTKEDITKLNRLNRALSEFENSIDTGVSNKSKISGSVILKPFRDQSKVFIRFWSTTGEAANQIKPLPPEEKQKQCEIIFGPDLKSEKVKLITMSTGGKNQPTEEEHLDTLRKLILTRGRIVTIEDIRAFCFEHFSGKKITVEVTKSFVQSQNPGQGITRVVDVKITLLEKGKLNTDEILQLKSELLQKLEQNSANVMPFRIEII
jgi:hypothetical protein